MISLDLATDSEEDLAISMLGVGVGVKVGVRVGVGLLVDVGVKLLVDV